MTRVTTITEYTQEDKSLFYVVQDTERRGHIEFAQDEAELTFYDIGWDTPDVWYEHPDDAVVQILARFEIF